MAMQHKHSQPQLVSVSGFTLIELMMVIAILGVMATVALPVYDNYYTRAGYVETAIMLGNWSREFQRWQVMNGRYPNDSHIVLPPEAERELNILEAQWLAPTALGGNWNWEGPNGYPYAGISIVNATASVDELEQFDHILDNGLLDSGRFRQTRNGRYTYIIDE